MKIAVLHSQILQGATRDEQDIMVQVEAVSQALGSLGFEPVIIPFSPDLELTVNALLGSKPDLVFNLVETVIGSGRFVHLAPTILDYLKIPYTGSRTEAIFLTSNKLLAKKILKPLGIPTPKWISLESTTEEDPVDGDLEDYKPVSSDPHIIKSVWEHASIGLDEGSVITADTRHTDRLRYLRQEMEHRKERDGQDCFAEIYIEGREFNLSLLASDNGPRPQVLPPAEIRFEDYPSGKFKIVDYRAKWDEDSFEYRHTSRCFEFPDEDRPLLKQLAELAKKCWYIFKLAGYARVDFRVDQAGKPWVLEINANPCLSPDSGFAAAAKQTGLSFEQLIQRIINDSWASRSPS